MICDQRQRRLAAPLLVESSYEAEQVLLFCTRSLTMEQPAFSMNFLSVFSCVSSSRTRGRVTAMLCISHDRMNERTDGWVAGQTEELIMTTERCTCTHKRRFTCLLHNLPTRHTSNSSEWKRAFALFLFYVLTHIHSQGVRIREMEWLLEILSLRCRL
jgi:hypothetical protein